jgi:hypothetical protein
MSEVVVFEVVDVVGDPLEPITRADEVIHLDVTTPTIENVTLVEEVVQVEVTDAAVAAMSIVEEAIHVETFATGPPGPQGPEGPAGPPGTGAYYRHVQASPGLVWTVNHNLGFYPSVNVADSGGNQWFGDVKYLDEDNLTITFAYPFGGTADLT